MVEREREAERKEGSSREGNMQAGLWEHRQPKRARLKLRDERETPRLGRSRLRPVTASLWASAERSGGPKHRRHHVCDAKIETFLLGWESMEILRRMRLMHEGSFAPLSWFARAGNKSNCKHRRRKPAFASRPLSADYSVFPTLVCAHSAVVSSRIPLKVDFR